MMKAKRAVPEGYYTLTSMLTLEDAAKAIDWYCRAFGAEEISRAVGPDGKVMHAELRIGNSRMMVNDAMMGMKGPKSMGGSPANMWVYVENCDALYDQALAAGAQMKMPMDDQFWGDRCGTIDDPYGYSWTIATRMEDLTPEEMQMRQAEYMKRNYTAMYENKYGNQHDEKYDGNYGNDAAAAYDNKHPGNYARK